VKALAVADTLVLLVIFLLRSFRYVAPLVNVDYTKALLSLYGWLFPCAYVLRMVNAWLTVLLTVDRYIAVCRPLHAQRLCTIQRAYTNIVAVTAASVVYCLPRFFEDHSRSVHIHPIELNQLLERPHSTSHRHFSNIVADREFSTDCYLFTVSNSGLLSVQRLIQSPTHS